MRNILHRIHILWCESQQPRFISFYRCHQPRFLFFLYCYQAVDTIDWTIMWSNSLPDLCTTIKCFPSYLHAHYIYMYIYIYIYIRERLSCDDIIWICNLAQLTHHELLTTLSKPIKILTSVRASCALLIYTRGGELAQSVCWFSG